MDVPEIRVSCLGRIENFLTMLDHQIAAVEGGEKVFLPYSDPTTPATVEELVDEQRSVIGSIGAVMQYVNSHQEKALEVLSLQHRINDYSLQRGTVESIMDKYHEWDQSKNACRAAMHSLNNTFEMFTGETLCGRNKDPFEFALQVSSQYATYYDSMMNSLNYALDHGKLPEVVGERNHWDLTQIASRTAQGVYDQMRPMNRQQQHALFEGRIPDYRRVRDSHLVITDNPPANKDVRDIRLWLEVINDKTSELVKMPVAAGSSYDAESKKETLYVGENEWNKVWAMGTPIVSGEIEDRSVHSSGNGARQWSNPSCMTASILHSYGYHQSSPEADRRSAIERCVRDGALTKHKIAQYPTFNSNVGRKNDGIRSRYRDDASFVKTISAGRDVSKKISGLSVPANPNDSAR